jgi:Phosphotransferase system, galactitol-specific IIB component
MKIVAVCAFGVGSSLILKLTLERVMEDLGVKAEVDNQDMNSVNGAAYDVIFTSNQLAPEFRKTMNIPVYEITKYMDFEEVKASVLDFLEKHNR